VKEKEEDQIPKIDPAEIEILIGKFEQNKLGEEEKHLIVRMLRTLLMFVASLQEKKITLQRLRYLFFGRCVEPRGMKKNDSYPKRLGPRGH
jgi:hypothetical protein